MGAVGIAGSSQEMARTPGSFGNGVPWHRACWRATQVLRPAGDGKVPVIANLVCLEWEIELLTGRRLPQTLFYKGSF